MDLRELTLSGFSQNDHQTHPPEDTAATNDHEDESDENMERSNWSSKADYLLSVIGCAVGLGNVWRFPYLAYRNGGGTVVKSKIQGRESRNKAEQDLNQRNLKGSCRNYKLVAGLFLLAAGAIEPTHTCIAALQWKPCCHMEHRRAHYAHPQATLPLHGALEEPCSTQLSGYQDLSLYAACCTTWPLPMPIRRELEEQAEDEEEEEEKEEEEEVEEEEKEVEEKCSYEVLPQWLEHGWWKAGDLKLRRLQIAVEDELEQLWTERARLQTAPSRPGLQKGHHSFSVQIVCDNVQRILHINTLFAGSYHDAFILSALIEFFKEDGWMTQMKSEANVIQHPPVVLHSSGLLSLVFSLFFIPYNKMQGCSHPLCNLTLDDGYFEIVNTTWLQENNETCTNGSEIYVPHQGPSEQYWDKVVLRRTSSMDETGEIVWYLALCLLLAWLIVGTALSKGIKSSGKVVYFTATFPYAVLTILLIRGVTLEGAYKGIEYYIGSQSDFSKLADAEAATNEHVSERDENVERGNSSSKTDYLLSVIGCAVGLGNVWRFPYLAYRNGGGFGLAFIAYPEALAQLPWAPLWSILFFFMLVTLGLDSLFATAETVVTTLLDQFPKFLRSKRLHLTIGICLLFCFLGLVSVTQAGIYWINLIDHFCNGWGLIAAALLELIGLSWIYGINRFIKDIEMMIGERSCLFWLWWRVCWFFISPCLLAVILIWSLATFATPTYGPVEYPIWATALGWCMIIFCIMWIPIVAIVRIAQTEGSTFQQKISTACTSAPDWGPYLEQHRGERYRNRPDSTEAPKRVQLLTTTEM
ncbi:sodium- and chloride-dependent neutral and basic amino acid transporter B(0+)-like [Heptranchias perlo]|uniref:sodium- and chloride-dependent neutral and basic amino acid transporter B(0+)-like n=1 Tax=Heptranchias perlo TaxID=212740 RepID=UPI00355A96FF